MSDLHFVREGPDGTFYRMDSPGGPIEVSFMSRRSDVQETPMPDELAEAEQEDLDYLRADRDSEIRWADHYFREAEALKARVAELEGALADDDQLVRFAVDRGLISDHAHKLLLQRDALKARIVELSTEHLHLSHEVEALEEWNFWLSRTLRDMARRATSFRSERNEAQARVEQLTAALTEIAHDVCDDYDSNNYDSCEVAGRDRDEWCAACIARAALAVAVERNPE